MFRSHKSRPEDTTPQADSKSGDRHNTLPTRLARPNSQARTGTGEYSFPCSADHEQDWQPYPVDPYSAICDDRTYSHILFFRIQLILVPYYVQRCFSKASGKKCEQSLFGTIMYRILLFAEHYFTFVRSKTRHKICWVKCINFDVHDPNTSEDKIRPQPV